jgi:hypothetical protein
MKSDRLKILLAFVVVALIFSLLSLVYWDFVRDAIVTPIYYVMWMGDLTLKSIPQEVFLALLLLLCIIIGVSTLERIRSRQAAPEGQRGHSIGGTRYLFWKKLCDHLDTSQFSRNHFASETRRLILSILASQEGVDVFEVEKLVATGDIAVPDSVRNLILKQEMRASKAPQNRTENWISWLRGLIFGADAPHDSQIDQQADEIVRFIEQRLEITRDGN